MIEKTLFHIKLSSSLLLNDALILGEKILNSYRDILTKRHIIV